MLETWGGEGLDTISENEFAEVGYDVAEKYCKTYCWHYGNGYCNNCAYEKAKKSGVDMRGEQT